VGYAAFAPIMNGEKMKDGTDATAIEQTPEKEDYSNRRLIRPSLNRRDHNSNNHNNHSNRIDISLDRHDRPDRHGPPPRKNTPPEQTNAENFYYQKQMQAKTPMVIVLSDGEEIHGIIEWYDSRCIKVNRNGQSNLMIYKPSIKYMFKEGENGRKA